MSFSSLCLEIFEQSCRDYHEHNRIEAPENNPFDKGTIESLLYSKNFIDTVQWHMEDLVRNPAIEPQKGLELKRSIDKSNQDRTDVVERIDDYFLVKYKDVDVLATALLNTESPAWAIDRLSILVLKIWHMREEVQRVDASEAHRVACSQKLNILLEQQTDLSASIDQLLEDLSKGVKRMKVYRQMKMYNDPSLNPVLYKQSVS
jgi:hypothetical protein